MSGTARARLSNDKLSASILALARVRENGSRTDHSRPKGHSDLNLLERLEAENRELRNRVVQIALQMQVLRHAGRPKKEKSAGDAAPKRNAISSASGKPASRQRDARA